GERAPKRPVGHLDKKENNSAKYNEKQLLAGIASQVEDLRRRPRTVAGRVYHKPAHHHQCDIERKDDVVQIADTRCSMFCAFHFRVLSKTVQKITWMDIAIPGWVSIGIGVLELLKESHCILARLKGANPQFVIGLFVYPVCWNRWI